MPIRFSIYYHAPENQAYLRKIIDASGGGQLVDSNDLDHLPAQAVNSVDVVLLDYQDNLPALDHWIEKITADPKSPAIFLFFKEISTNNLWKALRLGAKECFTYPIYTEDFQQAIGRLAVRTEVKKALAKPAQIISFLGSKGGVGTTFLVANIASLLAQEHQGKVLVVDLDLGFGQFNFFFDIHPEHTMIEVLDNLERLDEHYLQNILYPLGDNLYLLPAPARLEDAEIINAGQVDQIIHFIRENLGFRWILVDCCHHFDEITLKVLELSEILMLVSAQSVPALSNAKKILDILNLLDLKGLEVDVLINLWDRQNALTRSDVERFLGKPVAATITCDYKQVNASINEGKPLVQSDPRHVIAGDLRVLTGPLSAQDAPEATNGGVCKWFQRLCQFLRRKK